MKLVFLLLISGVLVCSTQTRLPIFAAHNASPAASSVNAQQSHQRFPEPQKKFWDGYLAPVILLAILVTPPPIVSHLRQSDQTETPVAEHFSGGCWFRPPPLA